MSQSSINTHPTEPAADLATPRLRRAFRLIKLSLLGYLGLGGLLLVIDAVISSSGHGATVNSLMWGRSAGAVGSGAVFLWFAAAAARGQRWAFRRLRIVTIAIPIIVVGLMIIPGVAPLWFKIIQFGCAACVAVTAFVINAPQVRKVFSRPTTAEPHGRSSDE